ncbi:envelope stress response membrane protein PspB [Hyphococcus sp.]|jgi:phage shock protein B|uniref:envelope stress response membrane protein PspB n=1 Tax=Hyphococcus sp. TaxID=2038636 RepID=UPI003D0E605B
MNEYFMAIAIVAIIFVACPAVFMHYQAELRKTKSISTDDERLVDDLWKTAQRLERRVDALETILDKEAPDWRKDYPERPHA